VDVVAGVSNRDISRQSVSTSSLLRPLVSVEAGCVSGVETSISIMEV
jgi:hypothetical protein